MQTALPTEATNHMTLNSLTSIIAFATKATLSDPSGHFVEEF